MTHATRSDVVAQIEAAITDRGAKREGNEIRFGCPYPDRHRNGDKHPSARWNRDKAVWRCDVCGAAGGYVSLARALGIDTCSDTGERWIVATYDYLDERGELLYQVVRYDPKAFRQRQPAGKGGWLYNLHGARRVPYRLPELLAAPAGAPVFVVEGEKDVDALRVLGLTATCNPGGAGKWRADYNEHLRGRHIVLIPDGDEPGRRHADDVVRHLLPGAASVRRLELPGAKDVSDWLAAGHTASELLALANAAAVITDSVPTDSIPHGWAAAESAPAFLSAATAEVDFLDEERVIAPRSLTEIFSPRGLGKTHYAIALAVAQARTGKRVLYVDRDNSRREVKRRLRAWGAADRCETLHVITREHAPPLTDTAAWAEFPVTSYDLVVIDSLDSSAEGVGEQDSSKPSRAIGAVLDVVRAKNGPAVLVLGNVIKSGAHSRGSGVIEDRADIVFEVRDATDLRPTGTKAWWEELPPAGAETWASRATRRRRRDSYRLAFIPSKYRVGEEPDPFVMEIDLSLESWTITNVTAELIAAGDAAQRTAENEKRARIDAAAKALSDHVERCAEAGKVLLADKDAVPFLRERGLTRDQARELIATGEGVSWRSQPTEGRGKPVALIPPESPEITAEKNGSGNPRQTRLFDTPISAERMGQAPRKSDAPKPAPEAGFRDDRFPPRTSPEHSDGCDCETCTPPVKDVVDL
jgi:hypothetical protein